MDEKGLYNLPDFTLWADQASIMIKVRERNGDPVELSEGEAEALIEVLTSLLEKIR